MTTSYTYTAEYKFWSGGEWGEAIEPLVFRTHSEHRLSREEAIREAKHRLSFQPGHHRLTRVVETVAVETETAWTVEE